MPQTFDPILLRTFLAVATGLSFTRAAEQLGLRQVGNGEGTGRGRNNRARRLRECGAAEREGQPAGQDGATRPHRREV